MGSLEPNTGDIIFKTRPGRVQSRKADWGETTNTNKCYSVLNYIFKSSIINGHKTR